MNEDQLHQIAAERNISPTSVASQSSIIPPATQHEADASERSWGQLFKDMGQSFLDAIDIPLLSPIARPLMAAADTPRWRAIQDARAIMANKRKQSDLLTQNASQHEANKLALEQNAIEQGKANVQSTFLRNMGLEQSLPIEQKILENRLESSDLSLTNQISHDAMVNGNIKTNAYLNSLPDYKKLQEEASRQEIMSSVEYVNYDTFNAMSDLAPRAMDDLVNGKTDSHAIQAMQQLAARVECRFVQDKNGLPCLVDRNGKMHELDNGQLEEFKKNAETALANKTREVLGSDAGMLGGIYDGEARLNTLERFTGEGMMSRPQAREIYENLMKEFQNSPFLRDIYAMSSTLDGIINKHPGMDIFAQANIENLPDREKNAILSIMGLASSQNMGEATGLSKYGIEVKPNQAGGWTVFDSNRQLSGKPQFDARELPAILKQQDYIGREFEKIIQASRGMAINAQAAQEAKLTGMILRNNGRRMSTGGLGEGNLINEEQDDQITDDQKQEVFSMQNGKSKNWEDKDYQDFFLELGDYKRKGKEAGIFDDNGNIRDDVPLDRYEAALKLRDTEKDLIPNPSYRKMDELIDSMEYRLGLMHNEQQVDNSSSIQRKHLETRKEFTRYSRDYIQNGSSGVTKFYELSDREKINLMERAMSQIEKTKDTEHLAKNNGDLETTAGFVTTFYEQKPELFKHFLEALKEEEHANKKMVEPTTRENLRSASRTSYF